jgi:cytochrome c553
VFGFVLAFALALVPAAALMKPVVDKLSVDDMLAIAAYLCSRAP